jgi:hypothetical protein
MDQVRREIDQEVRRLRASGVFPPSFERRLEDTFAQVVPVGVVERETAEVLRHLEGVSHVDVEVPTASNLPGGSSAKQLLRRVMAWYMEYLAAQLNRFMASTVRALRLLDERVSALEASAPDAQPPIERGTPVDLDVWADLVVERLSAGLAGRPGWGSAGAPGSGSAGAPGSGSAGAPGSGSAGAPASGSAGAPGWVLHAECGTGELLRRLTADGIDAYGIDSRADLLDEAVLALPGAGGEGVGLDVRWADPLDHLRALEDDSLGGLVLTGCVDRFEVGAQRELAALIATKLRPGAVVAVLGTTPSAWLARRVGLEGSGPDLVEADLAPGRPLHPETWAWMLSSEGLGDVEVVLAPSPGPGAAQGVGAEVTDVPTETSGTWSGQVSTPELARIVAMLSGPTSFAVVATRPAASPWP